MTITTNDDYTMRLAAFTHVARLNKHHGGIRATHLTDEFGSGEYHGFMLLSKCLEPRLNDLYNLLGNFILGTRLGVIL